jgi:predicted Zn-dependent protease
MGIGKWMTNKVTDKMAGWMTPRFPANGAALQVSIDDTIAEDYDDTVRQAITVFGDLIKEVTISKEKLPAECWCPKRKQYNVISLVLPRQKVLRLYLVGGDIFMKSMNWAYGITSPLTGVATVGTARFTNSEIAIKLGLSFTRTATRAALTREVQHEVSHLFGLLDHPEGSHVGSCIMNQTMHVLPPGAFMMMAAEQKPTPSSVFCSDCNAWLAKFRNDMKARNLKPYAERLLDA